MLLDVAPARRRRQCRSSGAVHSRSPEVRFLALSVSDAAEDVIGVIRAGARGYVTKNITGRELVDAIGRVADGDAVFSPRLAGFVLDAFPAPRGRRIDAELDRLTAREREVMRLIARGYAYKEVAKRAVHLDQDRGDPRRRACCASCSCPADTSSPAGRPTAGLYSVGGMDLAEKALLFVHLLGSAALFGGAVVQLGSEHPGGQQRDDLRRAHPLVDRGAARRCPRGEDGQRRRPRPGG